MENGMDVREIRIADLWNIFVRRFWLMALAAILAVGGVLAYNVLLFTPRYQATTTLYILRQPNENDSSSTASTDFSLALNVVRDCDYLLKSDTVVRSVKEDLELGEEYGSLVGDIETNNPSGTRILEVTVEAESPEMAKSIADKLCEIGAANINRAMGYSQVSLYEQAPLADEPCNEIPLTMYLIVGFCGAILVYGIFLVIFLLDGSIKSDEDVRNYLGVSVLGEIPDAEETRRKKYGYYKYYGKNKYQYSR